MVYIFLVSFLVVVVSLGGVSVVFDVVPVDIVFADVVLAGDDGGQRSSSSLLKYEA